jgi:exopolyphosphatase / guanosine-5'-triphosphate,3'-diphosphate pyrophosphatase
VSIRAAIDVGSNSVKLLVLDIAADGTYRVLADRAAVTGLGRGLGERGPLDRVGVRETLDCLALYVLDAYALGAQSIRAAGTSALRRATDAPRFKMLVAEETGLDIEVISGEEEARLARAVALRELPAGSPSVVFFDVGGGSTELTVCHGATVTAARSLELGARRCTEEAAITHPVDQAGCDRLSDMIRLVLANAPILADSEGAEPPRLAGLGGTASEVVWILRGQRGEPKGDPHLAQVTRAETAGLLDKLGEMTLPQLQELPNADPKRSGVIYAGCAIILELLRLYGARQFTLVDRGLRWGLLLG